MVNLYTTEEPINIIELNKYLAELLGIPQKRVNYNHIRRAFRIEMKRNRHITVCTHQLSKIKEHFECDDIIISSPYRCCLEIKLWYRGEMKRRCCCRH